MRNLTLSLLASILMISCGGQGGSSESPEESREAKAMLQGVWLDDESGDVTFRIKGDTIYYADTTSMPAYFKIVQDSLVLASGTKYGIAKHTEHLFWFTNQSGDVVKLVKSDDAEDEKEFVHDTPKVLTFNHQVKIDSVVNYNGVRYHWYIAINPTKYKVSKRTYNDDCMEVENVYYDNIMHIAVFKDAQRVFSSDFRKQQYASKVPKDFINDAILGNMEYSHIDAEGLHFNATLCIPDGASCYLVETIIDYGGKMSMKLVEY